MLIYHIFGFICKLFSSFFFITFIQNYKFIFDISHSLIYYILLNKYI